MLVCKLSLVIVVVIVVGGCAADQITFGQSADMSGPAKFLGARMRAGILAAFAEVNSAGGAQGRTLSLVSLDDGYVPATCATNTQLLLASNVTALIGYVGTAPAVSALPLASAAGVPMIGTLSGSNALRIPYQPNAINVRVGYDDETAAMVNLLVGTLLPLSSLSKVSIFYQSDAFGQAGVNGLTRALGAIGQSIYSSGSYARGTLAVSAAVSSIFGSSTGVQVVVLFGTAAASASFVQLARQHPNFVSGTKFLVASFVGAEAFRDALGTASQWQDVYMTQVVPFPSDTSSPLVASYRSSILSLEGSVNVSYDYPSLEGYLVGRFVADVARRVDAFTGAEFLRIINTDRFFQVDLTSIGLYSDQPCGTGVESCMCNNGMRQVWTSSINSLGSFVPAQNQPFQFSLVECASPLSAVNGSMSAGPTSAPSPTCGTDGLTVGLVAGLVILALTNVATVVLCSRKRASRSAPYTSAVDSSAEVNERLQ